MGRLGWAWPRWERAEILREQVSLLRHNFPMTLLASLATALGTLWVMARVAEPQAITVWLVSHALVVAGVYLTLRSIAPFTDPAQQAARKLIACMAAMGLSWGSLGYVVLYWGTPESVIYAIGIISTVSSGALGLGAPLYRAYVTYLTCAIGGVMMAVALAGGPVMWPALFLTGVYYALTGMQARTADRATRRSIALKLENDRLVSQLRAESPIFYCEDSKFGPYWSVTTYKPIQHIEALPKIFSSSWEYGGITVAGDGVEHLNQPSIEGFYSVY